MPTRKTKSKYNLRTHIWGTHTHTHTEREKEREREREREKRRDKVRKKKAESITHKLPTTPVL